jgi:AmpD protein
MVIQSYLDIHNSQIWNKNTLGNYIRELGYLNLWNDRPLGTKINTIIIHSMSAIDDVPTMPFDLIAQLYTLVVHKVSAHYLICRDGVIWALVPEEFRAWHAGGSIMPLPDLRRDVNDFSIGIELTATENSGFTSEQYDALSELCLAIEKRYAKPINYLGHEHVASSNAVSLGLRLSPKTDPGKGFDWDRLRMLLLKNDLLLAQRL